MRFRQVGTALAFAALGCMPALAVDTAILVEDDGFRASIGATATCGPNMTVALTADDDKRFADAAAVARIVNGARAALGFRCSQLTDLLVVGIGTDGPIYGAISSAKNNWDPVGIDPKFAASVFLDDTEPPAPEAPSFMADLNFPGLVAALLDGRPSDIPDDAETRKVVFSILSIFGERCSPLSLQVTRSATIYVSPELGNAMFSGNMDDMANLGANILLETLQGISKGPKGVFDYAEANAVRVAEGVEDGRTITRYTGCAGPDYRTISSGIEDLVRQRSGGQPSPFDAIAHSSLMSEGLRNRLGYKDPATAKAERELELQIAAAGKSCESRFGTGGFCGCAIEGGQEAGLSVADWQSLGENFMNATQIGALRDVVRACNK